MVHTLAAAVCIPLTGDKKLLNELEQLLEQQISIATQVNTAEGLIIEDTTPEWIQALGINYPFRRIDGKTFGMPPAAPPTRQKGNGQ